MSFAVPTYPSFSCYGLNTSPKACVGNSSAMLSGRASGNVGAPHEGAVPVNGSVPLSCFLMELLSYRWLGLAIFCSSYPCFVLSPWDVIARKPSLAAKPSVLDFPASQSVRNELLFIITYSAEHSVRALNSHWPRSRYVSPRSPSSFHGQVLCSLT